MRKTIIACACACICMLSCRTGFNAEFKSTDIDYKYEAAKQYYAQGKYSLASQLLEDVFMFYKGTENAEESMFMLGMCYLNNKDWETASLYLDRYIKSYQRGTFVEQARFYTGYASYMQSPDPRLDQSPTYSAINNLQEFLDFHPYSQRREQATDLLYDLQNRLVEKEFYAAKLYYNLGTYTGNCTNGGSNYEACIITSENALKNYPYTSLREELMIMLLRARYNLARHSVMEKADARYREAVEEYHGFMNEFPDSKYSKEAANIYRHATARLKGELLEDDKDA